MYHVGKDLWPFLSFLASFLVAHAATIQTNGQGAKWERAVRIALYVAATLGLARQLWLGVLASVVVSLYEDLRWRRRTRT